MFLDKKIHDIPNIQDAISLNREIVCFFQDVGRDRLIRTIDDICPNGISLRDNIIHIGYELYDPMNISALLNRLVRITRKKQLRGDMDSMYSKLFSILLIQKAHLFHHKWTAQGVGNVLYGLQYSSTVPTEIFLALAQVIPGILNWSAQDIGMSFYGLQNSSNVPIEFFQAFAQVIPRVQSWDAQGVGNALYGLQNISNVPENLLQAFAQVILEVSNWRAQDIGNALYGISHLKGLVVDDLVTLLFERAKFLSIEGEGFIEIQSLVIGLNHASIGIPENIQSRWDKLVNTESKYYATTTRDEKYLIEYIKNNFGEDVDLLNGVYLQGYEVDIVILDSRGQIFAIIESDGGTHNSIKKKNKDRKRDQYFLREGVTDLVIRVSASGCRVIETEN